MFRVFRDYRRQYSTLKKISDRVIISEEVQHALAKRLPVVALESTIITHGMPFPKNVECALSVEAQVREMGVIPATIAILKGIIRIGLSHEDISFIGDVVKNPSIKTSRRDFAYVIGNKLNGGTTVSGTLFSANIVGIPIFATGGIGGVHRSAEITMDVSADLMEMGRTPMAVVSSGVKSILDIPKTLEYLETQGVFVATYGPTKRFPAFYTTESGCEAPYSVSSAAEAALVIESNREMNLNSGMLFAVPVPAECSMDGTEIEAAIEDALALAKQKDVSGKDITPFLLSYLAKATNGRSLESNIALVRNNAKVAAEIAIALSDLEREKSRPVGSSDVVVVGGSILDRCARISDKHIELDGRVHYGRITENAGGVARNMSEALNKLRSHRPVAFISAIGDDSSGSLVAQSLGPHVEHLERVRGSRTAQCMVVLDSDGECKFLVGDMDVHARITPEMVNAKADLIADSKLIVLDGNPSLDTMETILELAHKNDISVFFEPTDVPICHKPFQCRYRSSIKYISPNLNELKCIAKSLNIPTSDKDVIYIAGRVAEYVSNIIVTMGSDGVLIVRRNSAKSKLHSEADQGPLQIRHYPASKVENLINVSGAGDCFASGIIAAMLEGMSEEICVSVGFESANKALYTDKTVPDYFFNREDEAWTKPAYYKIIK